MSKKRRRFQTEVKLLLVSVIPGGGLCATDEPKLGQKCKKK